MAEAADRIELLRLLEEKLRRRARSDLNAYCRYIEIPGAPVNDDPDCAEFYPDTVTPAAHHILLNNALMRLGVDMRRLMVFMPPGSAKSTYVSVTFPTWFMGNHRRKNIISTSYNSTLATRFGRKCRQITRSPKFRDVFGHELVQDNRAADDWSLTNEATYMAAGILAGITGNRADGLIIDDPIKGRQDADSETIRNSTWEAYKSDLLTRLKPGGWIAIVQTRWHEDDLSGRILPETWKGESGWITSRDGEPWFVICLPAECEHPDDPLGRRIGEWLWTDWFTPAHWAQLKRTQGERNWSALYQQRPSPSEGGMFKRNWFAERYREAPSEHVMIVQSWDTAYKPAEVNDPSVCSTWMVTRFGYWLLHVYRDRLDYPSVKRAVKSLAASWNPNVILIEDKASGQSLIQELRSETRLPIVAIEPEGDKITRANACSGLCESGRVHLPEVAEWLMEFELELFAFPLSTTKDQVDSVSQFLNWIHEKSVELEAWGSGQQRAGLIGFHNNPEPNQSHIDDSTGYGIVRSDTDTSGF